MMHQTQLALKEFAVLIHVASNLPPTRADIVAVQTGVSEESNDVPLGNKRTFAVQNGMSALPPKADLCSATRYVRFVPIADSCSATKRIVIRSPRRRSSSTARAPDGNVDTKTKMLRHADE